ncbi:MAG: hypothetical protein HN396_15285 [Gemmatimonadales bacterium]|jgi:hypothetical protein|nr:hypothetical protein [Gemmatimonadales bacterium]MBT7693787.1 hypothetical protein [Gemmatimonadales bacterium]
MKTDLYTKIVLTVIAVTLIGMLAQNVSLTATAHAQDGDVQEVKIVAIRRGHLENWESLPVAGRLGKGDVPVSINAVGYHTISSAVPVAVE